MENGSKKYIENIIAQKKNEIKNIDDAFIGDVIGVAQATMTSAYYKEIAYK